MIKNVSPRLSSGCLLTQDSTRFLWQASQWSIFQVPGIPILWLKRSQRGASKVTESLQLLRIVGEQITNGRWKDDQVLEQLAQADAIVFGTPTYMGGVAAQFKAFLDAASSAWFAQQWKDKIAGGFTHSSSLSGDKQGTLLYLAINAAQHDLGRCR